MSETSNERQHDAPFTFGPAAPVNPTEREARAFLRAADVPSLPVNNWYWQVR